MIRFCIIAHAALALALLCPLPALAFSPGTFAIASDHFVLNGKPFQILSGELHYPRIPREYWRDRLLKARAMGLNTICTYLFWNCHEPAPGQFTFEGNLDIAAFVQEARQAGLYVIIRPGPYVCSEWDFGGLPAWLLRDREAKVRCMDPPYVAAVQRYIRRVAAELHGLQISAGGPIIMVQVENEYGSYGNDKEYLRLLRDELRRFGFTVPLYTSDGGARYLLESGTLDDVLPVVNFGEGPEGNFAELGKFRSGIPHMCGEYWCGWFTHWGDKEWGRADLTRQSAELSWMLKTGKSVNLYMFHGGTNFGFYAGANFTKAYEPDVTSYDYDAPLDEAGRHTKKFYVFRDLLRQYQHGGAGLPELPVPLPSIEVSSIPLTECAPLFGSLPAPVRVPQPKSMESFGQSYGFILYRTTLIGPQSGTLEITDPHDYASIYVNGRLIGRIDRRLGQSSLELPAGTGPAPTLDILVEGMGRVNFGPRLLDRKGITDRVTLAGVTLMNWEVFLLPMDAPYLNGLRYTGADSVSAPGFFKGMFNLADNGDTYLDMKGWKKGVVWVNGHNLGRFWDVGPQERLFVPGPFLWRGQNEIVVFDIEKTRAPALRCVKTMR